MAALLKKFWGRTTQIVLEALAVIACLLLLALAVFAWRINSGPLDITFARDYVQASLHDSVSGYSITLDHAAVAWPELRGPLRLRLQNVGVVKHGQTVLDVGQIDLALSKRALLLGQIAPVGIEITNPALRLVRTADNRIVISMKDEAAPPDDAAGDEAADASPLMQMLRSLSKPEAEIDKRSPLDRLRMLDINGAQMVMEDHVLGVTWYMPDLDLVFMRDREGLLLTADMALPGAAGTESHITADIAYRRARHDIGVKLTLRAVDPQVLAGKIDTLSFLDRHDISLSGEVQAVFDSTLALQDIAVNAHAVNGAFAFPDIYEAPFTFEKLAIQSAYDRASKKLTVSKAEITTQGITATVTADMIADENAATGKVNLAIPELPQEKIAALWPDSARDSSAASWLIERMTGGRYHDLTAALDLAAVRVTTDDGTSDWEVTADNIVADVALAGMDVDYRAPLMPAVDTVATGHYENDNLVITITDGMIGDLDIAAGKVSLFDIFHGEPGQVEIDAQLEGPLPGVFAYIAREPIGMSGDDLGFAAAQTDGKAALDVDIKFPALKDLPAEQVKVAITGTLRDTYVPGVVQGLALTGGPLALTVADDMVTLAGAARLDNRDITLKWQQYFESEGKPYMGRVEASGIADRDLRQKLGIDLDDWVEGAVPIDIVYTEFRGGRSEIKVDANLRPATVKVEPFNYAKPPGIEAQATALVLLQDGRLHEVQNLDVTTPDLDLKKGRLIFRNEGGEDILRQGEFPHARLGENDFNLQLEVLQGGLTRLDVRGAFFDARPFLGGGDPASAGADATTPQAQEKKEKYDGPAIIASIDVARMRTHPGRLVNDAKIYIDMARTGIINRLEVDARAGQGAVYFRLRPDEQGVMTVRLEADDAGAAINAFGIYDNIRGGKLVIAGRAADPAQPRSLYGDIQMTDFRAVNAPILARLVSAISPTGIAELLGNDGIYFARLESKFDWHLRPEGDLYILTGGRTSGSSLGLTFEGNINAAENRIDIDGNIVPISMVNSFISNIPVIGTVLSGGSEGGIFAATYTIKGPQDDPNVAVNPLSMLTPGIIRRILFEEE